MDVKRIRAGLIDKNQWKALVNEPADSVKCWETGMTGSFSRWTQLRYNGAEHNTSWKLISNILVTQAKTKLRGLSPQANYTNRETADYCQS
jgi:hypothetical protein